MNRDFIKQKLAELSAQAGSNQMLWKPAVGTTDVRIVPYQHQRDWPFVELYFHYNIGKRTIISPVSFGRRDLIKEFSDHLKSTGDREDYKLGKQLEPKRRIYVPILVRGQEDEGVKFWGFGSTIYLNIVKILDDDGYGDITDPVNGRDIRVTFEKATKPGAFPTTSILPRPNQTPVTTDTRVLETLKNIPDVTTLWKEPTEEEMRELLKNFTEPGYQSERAEDADDDDDVDDIPTTTPGVPGRAPGSPDDIRDEISKYFKR